MTDNSSKDSTNKPLILVDGATGYLGNHLIAKLVQAGYRVRCLVHSGSREADLDFLRSLTGDIVQADFSESGRGISSQVFDSVYCLVHLIGSIAPKKGETLVQLHAEITAKLVEPAGKANLPRIVHVTALGARPDAPSQYHRSKWQAEEVVRNSGIAHTILRPSLIMGRTCGSRDSKLVRRLFEFNNKKPYVPLVNGGKNRLQPIFVDDVADAIVASVESDSVDNVIELGGSQVLEMRELVARLANRSNKKAKILPLPPAFARGIASVMEKVQDVPVLSADQVVLSLSDNVCQTNGFEALVGRPPLELDRVVETYDDQYIESL